MAAKQEEIFKVSLKPRHANLQYQRRGSHLAVVVLGCLEARGQVALPGYILLDAIKAALRAVSTNIGEVEGEGPHLLWAVRLGYRDVL